MKVLIVGAGVIGLSTAWALARLGHEAIIYEQEQIPNPLSASYDQHRMIRFHYGLQAGYTRMVSQAYEAWEELWTDLGKRHLADTGVLAISTQSGDWTEQSKATFDDVGQPYRVLQRREAEDICPYLDLPQGSWGLLTDGGGVLFADNIVADLARHLGANGLVLNPDTRVTAVDPAQATITLFDGKEETGDAIVLAAGAWIGKLLPTFGGPMQSIRSVVTYVDPPAQLAKAWSKGPAMFISANGAQLYSLPPVNGRALKFGGAPNLRPSDPDAPRLVAADEPEHIIACFSRFLKEPQAYRAIESLACCYADNGAKRFIVEPLGKALIVTNCSGRMFKFGALMGCNIARALTGVIEPAQIAEWAAGSG